jgi:hypothetical protein
MGPAVTDHDKPTMSEAATEQDLYGLRTELAKGFAICLYEVKKTIRRTYFALFLAIAALLSIDRWWR